MLRELAPDAKVVYDTVDLHFVRERRRVEIDDSGDAARNAKRYYDMELSLSAHVGCRCSSCPTPSAICSPPRHRELWCTSSPPSTRLTLRDLPLANVRACSSSGASITPQIVTR